MNAIIIAAVLGALAGPVRAQAPNTLTYQGRLLQSGAPVSGSTPIDMQICDSASGGNCYDSGSQTVGVVNGVFSTTFTLVTTPPLPGQGLASGTWFLETVVNGTPLSPREQLTSSPYAVFASSAETLTPPLSTSPGVSISTNVGIGTASPQALLHVYSATSGLSHVIVEGGGLSANVPDVELRGSAAGSGTQVSMNKADATAASIVDFEVGAASHWQLAHESQADGDRLDVNEVAGGAAYPRLTAARGGDVGVGVTSPLAQLHVSSPTSAGTDLVFMVSNGPALAQNLVTVTGDGGLGVGTTAPLQADAPGARLDVRGPASVNGPLLVDGGSGSLTPLSVGGDASVSGDLRLIGAGSALVVSGGGGVNAGGGGVQTTGNISVTGGAGISIAPGGSYSGDGSSLSNVLRTISSATLSGAAGSITVGPFSSLKYMRAVIHIAGVSSSANLQVQLNGDSGSDYGDNRVVNGTESTDSGITSINVYQSSYGGTEADFIMDFPYNAAGSEKSGTITGEDYSGASAPSLVQESWVWDQTTPTIDSITITPTSGNLVTGTSIVVYGSN